MMNTFKEYIIGEEVEKDDIFIGMPKLKWEKGEPWMLLLKGDFLNCQSRETRQRLKADIASGKLKKTQLARAKKQGIEYIGSIINASCYANQYGISIAEYAKRLSSGSGTLLGKAGDDTPYFVVANRTQSGIENRAILPVKDLKNVQKDMQKVLASELKGGKNPFLCHDRRAKESDIVVPKPTGAMTGWIGEPIAPKK